MIINIRATGGAGKSTLVKRVITRYVGDDGWQSKAVKLLYEPQRKRPIGYELFKIIGDEHTLFVPGHYEAPCGGCDTITKPSIVFEMVRAHAEQGHHVLFEGIICQDDTKRTIALAKDYKVLIVGLTTTVEECLAGIQKRRDERQDERLLNPKNTTERAVRVHKNLLKLVAEGLEVHRLSRDAAYDFILERLGW